MDIDDFVGTSPLFLPEEFFAGDIEGWGVMERLTGGLQKRFTIKAAGSWDRVAQIVSFAETWTFDDGRSDTLTWKITKHGDRLYRGVETRIDGEAEGHQAGCAFHWRYRRDTPQDGGKSMALDFNDWFWCIEPGIAMVRGSAGRAGIAFSVVHATYRKLDGRAPS